MHTYKLLGATLAAMIVATPAWAGPLTVINYGGALADAQQTAFVEPFKKSTGTEVVASSYSGEQAKVKAMVDAGQVTWDVVEIESTDLGRGCADGLYERIDWNAITNKPQLAPGAVQRCGVGLFAWATAFAYNRNLMKTPPQGWKDFWDVKKFPGKRGMRKSARGNLEFALMADGVPAADVYKTLATAAGVDRAFRKLDALRPNIQWWDAGAQPAQFLVSGDVAMSTAFSGRVITAQRAGQPLDIVWNGAIGDYDYWVIPKGSPNRKAAEQFINFSVGTQAQLDFLSHLPGGPVNKTTIAKMTPEQLKSLPNAPDHADKLLQQNSAFWDEHGDDLDQRFAAWAAR